MCMITYSKDPERSSNKSKTLNDSSGTPIWALIEITGICSHKCAWCYASSNYGTGRHLTVAEFTDIANKLHAIGINHITICGGEPTEHPDFVEILEISTKLFRVNIATHGGWDRDYTPDLVRTGVSLLHFNFQGKKWHDQIHGITNTHDVQRDYVKKCIDAGIQTVGSTAVGAYNLDDIGDIFKEMNDLGMHRIRISDTTGPGSLWLKKLESKNIHERTKAEAAKLGFTHVYSMDPDFEGDVNVPCIYLEKVAMYVTCEGDLIFCCMSIASHEDPIANILQQDHATVLEKYHTYVDSLQRDKPYCVAREDSHESVIKFHKNMKIKSKRIAPECV